MSLVITGNPLIFSLFLLIALNGFFTFKKIPILGIPIAGISVVFLLAFSIDYSGFIIILLLLLIVCIISNILVNLYSTKS
jgi:uncharacterized membrane protein